MKNFIISVILLIISILSGFGQNAAIDAVFDRYALKPGFETVNISGDLLDLLAYVDDDMKELEKLRIDNIKILSVEDPALNAQVNFYSEIVPRLKLNDYVRLLNIEDENEQVIILNKKNRRGLQEFILITGGNENTLIYIEGDLNLARLIKVAKALDSGDMACQTFGF